MAASRSIGGRQVQMLEPIPMAPNCLAKDELPLPPNYVPPYWAKNIVAEWERAAELKAAGAYPTQSALVSGPSGVGKTTASRWMAKQLKLPVYSLSLASAIESYMGVTGANLDRAIRFGIATPCLLIMDEIDSVAGSRSAKQNDVGEIWRITNTLIQSIDLWHAIDRPSFLMATTNMPESVDSAIRRRFECEVLVELPTIQELSKMSGVALPETARMSHAAMRRIMLQARRASVMNGADYSLTVMGMVSNATAIDLPF